MDQEQPAGGVEDLPQARGPAWARLEDQLGWYGRRSAVNKRSYMTLKVLQLVGAAAVPVAASVHAAVWVTGGLGGAVVVLEGVQQLGQFQANWINYRGAAEGLAREKSLYLAGAGPYAGQADSRRLLAERVEGVVAQEHAAWTAGQQDTLHNAGQTSANMPGSTVPEQR